MICIMSSVPKLLHTGITKIYAKETKWKISMETGFLLLNAWIILHTTEKGVEIASILERRFPFWGGDWQTTPCISEAHILCYNSAAVCKILELGLNVFVLSFHSKPSKNETNIAHSCCYCFNYNCPSNTRSINK